MKRLDQGERKGRRMRAKVSSWLRGGLVATIAVGALAIPVTAQADPLCVPSGVQPPDGMVLEICIDQASPQVFYQLWIDHENVASGYIDVGPDSVTTRTYNDSTVVQVSAARYIDEGGEERIEVCVSLALGTLITPIEECRSRPLP